MHEHFIFDIETVPAQSAAEDPVLLKMASDKIEGRYKTPKTIDEHMARVVPSMALEPGCAQVACICWQLDSFEIQGIVDRDEKHLLTRFTEVLAELHQPTFVGFNSAKFDVPVLAAAYVRQGMSVPPHLRRALLEPYRTMIDYFRLFPTGLQRFAQALGLEPLAVTGADVGPLWEAGDLEAIKRHCVDDVRVLAALHHRVHGEPEVRGLI